MLTPEQLQNLPQELTDLYEQLSEFILRDIARRIAKGAQITDTAEYQMYRARSLGLSTDEIAAKIAEINGSSAAEVNRLIREAAAQSDEFDRKMLGADKGAAIPLEDNQQLQKLISAQIAETAGKCENLTNTMGFADHDFLGRVYYLSMTDMYRREMDAAHMKVATGATDYMTAIRQACNKLAASGVRTIDYESGRSDRIEVAARRAILTSVAHVTHRISEQNGEELGADGWEMSAHSGSRPSHAVYQGRQYTQEQYERIIKPLISEPNCRHDVFPIILGVSEPVYTEEELQNIDQPPFTYEGRKYTAYEASQQMRKMERAMRKQKDRCIVADATGDEESFTAASIKLRRQKDIYEDFCKAADSYTQYERTYVAGYDRRLAGKTGAVTRKQREFEKAQMRLTEGTSHDIIEKTETSDFKNIISPQNGMSKEYQTVLENKFSGGTADAKRAFTRYVKHDSVADSSYDKTAHFSPVTQKIKMNFAKDQINPKGSGTTFFHEHGHYIDYTSCEGDGYTSTKSPEFGKLLKSDFDSYVNSVMKQNHIELPAAYYKISKELSGHKQHSVSDLFGGISGNQCVGRYRHKDLYWTKNGAVEKEAFAHMYEAQFDAEKYELMKKYFPNALNEFEKLLNGVIK